MESSLVKRILADMGADLCGIASIDRFDDAPEGFHPRDVLPGCRSVIAFAKRFPAGTVLCDSLAPYTVARNWLSEELDRMSVLFCLEMERRNAIAVPTGTIAPTRYDAKTGRSRNPVSAKHCAVAAGLGRIGKNTLLVTPEYGNMVWLNAVLCEAELEPDPMLPGDPCPADCNLCVERCPAHALGDPAMNQNACFAHAFHMDGGGDFVFKCNLCRSICPNRFGTKNWPAGEGRA